MRRAGVAIAPALVIGVCAVLSAAPADARTSVPTIAVLSNRADLVSDGDALVRVTAPRGVRASRLRLTAGGRDVTRVLVHTGTRQLTGLVTGLPVGRVALVARIRGPLASARRRARGRRQRPVVFTGRARARIAARLYVTNHPVGGPVLAGPQIQPWTCQPGAKDAQCDQPRSYRLLYLPKGAPTEGATLPGTNSNSGGGPFQPYDPERPPPAGTVATTRTTEGVRVPFIVRLETGYIDRDQYAIATLFQPGKRWTATAPQ